ncbi:hypothetical protein HMPREF0083_01834 [Aneurinibacillus aneurinilyticus ATCC 12856]|uniref:Uncharacterized protein n=1 Tax=Aneurinibacillus aneurinilyticus ATCC 12856 TaxID=649747 RepID=U1X6A3_ANEAE|nr:hypothetical protein HMPREF0083_01834 [Aneurinibacillus aneurinilyticus ATCC 12856]
MLHVHKTIVYNKIMTIYQPGGMCMRKPRRTGRIEKVTELLYMMGVLSQEERDQMKKTSVRPMKT